MPAAQIHEVAKKVRGRYFVTYTDTETWYHVRRDFEDGCGTPMKSMIRSSDARRL